MQAIRRRAIEVPADRCDDDNSRPLVDANPRDQTAAAEVLDDAAVADLLEGRASDAATATPPFATGHSGVQQRNGERKHLTKNPVLVSTAMVAGLVIAVTIGFICVATRAPDIAGVLVLAFAVLTPCAVAAAVREHAKHDDEAASSINGCSEAQTGPR